MELLDIGEIPALGCIPTKMHAWLIRPERQGSPQTALRCEIIDVPAIAEDEALVLVMAAGLNYNGVWACLGKPVPVFALHRHPFHIPGSDAAGIVWAVGKRVRNCKVGDEVVVHCHQNSAVDDECNGGDPMNSPSQRIWGYETAFGSFAQFTKVQSRQLMPKPAHLGWLEASCYTLTLATAYRMLFGHPPHIARPGANILVWGAAGGLGTMAIQLATLAGANAIGVVGHESRREFAIQMGAVAVIDRNLFNCWHSPPAATDDPAYQEYLSEVRRFGEAIRAATGGEDVDMVIEHPGAATFPVSCFVAKRGGMIVFCASTTGFALSFDARFVWTRQKRIQGSHFANQKQANEANRLILQKRLRPGLGEVFAWHEVPAAHMKMLLNRHAPGNHAIKVGVR